MKIQSVLLVMLMVGFFVPGCGRPGLPPIDDLTEKLASAVQESQESRLMQCFVTMNRNEIDRTPAGLARQQTVERLMNDFFVKDSPAPTNRWVRFQVDRFEAGEYVHGTLTVTQGETQISSSPMTLQVRLSISGWRIVTLTY
ncbi:MAG: hypothetical protein LR011_10370 [Verrucomicrobia bacterium]|nr:hypothetical protein [Verrucomicrobiota bacterium]